MAQADDFVRAMPDGLESPIAQGGTNVSGGQRQRLAIARALVSKAGIYLFDDAFSALDVATDARLRAAMRPVTRDAVVIVVAQRVSSIIHADQIVVLDDGAGRGQRHPRRAARELPDVRRDRREPAGDGGGGMSELKTEEEKAAEQRRGPASARRGGPPHLQIGVPTEKSQNFVPVREARAAPAAPRAVHRLDRRRARRRQRRAERDRTEDPRWRDRPDLRRDVRPADPRRASPRSRPSTPCAPRARTASPTCSARCSTSCPARASTSPALAKVLLFVLGLYVVAALLQWMQGRMLTVAVNRTIYRLRRDVEDKLNRLALPYFDQQPRGELLSRVTNDIDNVAQSLQQTLSQLLTSLLTVVAMIAMMVWISPLLALHRPRDDPDHDGRDRDDRQAQPEALRAAVEEHRRGQRRGRGDLHRARAGQGLRPPAGGRPDCSPSATTSCTTRASGPSSSAASSCRR